MVPFLFNAVAISMSGVLAPGPMTAATLAAGAKNRHAGLLLAVGHGIVELPLMLLILAGIDVLLSSPTAQLVIGIVGGVFLLIMGGQMLYAIPRVGTVQAKPSRRGPIATGVVMTAGNPYFLLWWATVGLALASQAAEFGALAFALFATMHWLCDAIWLEVLSQSSFRGSKLFGARSEKIVLGICGAALLYFGLHFLFHAALRTTAAA